MWQRSIDTVLQGLPNVQVYLDDILVTGSTEVEHLKNLDSVLTRLEEFGLRVNNSKCEWFKLSVTYLGQRIDKDGLHTTNDKVEDILKAPPPSDEGQLLSFLGLVNYYAQFLPNLSTFLAPLNQLRSKNSKFVWTKKCNQDFEEAKRLVASRQALTHFDSELPLKLDCDASAYGCGAVISHVFPDGSERPVAFASRSLNSAEKNYAQIEREALSIVFGICRFHQYLYGRTFTLVSDHKPLTTILRQDAKTPPIAAARMQRWAFILSAYDYKIQFRSTHEHANADGLSRLPCVNSVSEVDIFELSDLSIFHTTQIEVLPLTLVQLQTETRRDSITSKVMQAVISGWSESMQNDPKLKPFYSHKLELTLQQNVIMWGIRTVIPQKLRQSVLDDLHEGHVGMSKMKSLARSYVWWPNVDQDIEATARRCTGCSQTQKMPPKSPLQPLGIP